MTEHLSANDDPVSQAALHLLNKAGLGTPSEHLYLLHLMLWGIETGKAEIDRELAENLESAVGNLFTAKPAKVLSWLVYPEKSRAYPSLSAKELRVMSPASASRELLDLLSDRLAATTDWEAPRPLRALNL